MSKRTGLLTGFVVLLVAGYFFGRPYLMTMLEFQELQKIQETAITLFDVPEKILRVNNELVNIPTPRHLKNYTSEDPSATRNAYFGDLHVHTALSFDAFAFGTTASPSDAYRFARGEVIDHPSGFEMQLLRPLDFYAVTDHAMFLGVVQEAADTSTAFSKNEIASFVHNLNSGGNNHWTDQSRRYLAFAQFIPGMLRGIMEGTLDRGEIAGITQDAWLDTIDAANEHYRPGSFTTFVGYEYTTSSNDFGNLHRNVIFESTDKLPKEPFSRFHSQNPEDLWDWMDSLREQGIESLAIPHNSNGSNGQMFKLNDWADNPLTDAYAEQRLRNEPLVEVTQVKGTSDTHPLLSKNDEWADFEINRYRIATTLRSEPRGSYVRDAYLSGLDLDQAGVLNPFKFGLIGSSDTHVAAPSLYEKSYHAKVGVLDSNPEDRGSVPMTGVRRELAENFTPDLTTQVDGRTYVSARGFEQWGASGLAGVWAEDNTRESIYAAFRRKETFATTGPRIKVRLFAGYDWPDDLLDSDTLLAEAYASGVPMGGDLFADGTKAPEFLVWAVADSLGAPLQRTQIIKGLVRGGERRETVYDVSCSDQQAPDPETHRCADNGATVDLADCSVSRDRGAGELKGLWRDPEFNPAEKAFYYVRVLENPTCRWSTWDALRIGVPPRPDLPKTIQERAWSSPIWFVNTNNDEVRVASADS
ncbi:MAG: DUF3604 domain-containing protein [Pseudomonadota bacterium]